MMVERLYRRIRELARVAVAFARLDAIDEMSYPMSIVMKFLGASFPIFIYFFVAKLVPPETLGQRVGGDYFTFTAIGLSVSAVMQLALSGFGSRLQIVQNQGTLETLLVEPAPWTFVPLAMNIWHGVSALAMGMLVIVTSWLLGANFVLGGLVAFTAILVLGAVAAMAIGIVSASILILSKRSQPVLRLYGLVASLLGGAVFPISLLPDWLELLTYVVPHRFVISASRQVIMQNPPSEGTNIGSALLALGIFDVVVLAAGVALFYGSLRYARRLGTLGTY